MIAARNTWLALGAVALAQTAVLADLVVDRVRLVTTGREVVLQGIAASTGLALGRIAIQRAGHRVGRTSGTSAEEREALRTAMATAATQIEALADSIGRMAAAILEFQTALLDDDDLIAPIFERIAEGAPADAAWRDRLDAEIAAYEASGDDILLVQINPLERRELPTNARAIQDRLNEITFNASLLRELRAVDFVTRLIDDGKLSTGDYKRVLMHRIDGGLPLAQLTSSSRLNSEWNFLLSLRDLGRTAAKRWLKRNYAAIGVQGTLDLKEAIS